MNTVKLSVLLVLAVSLAAGCSSNRERPRYQTVPRSADRDSWTAQRLNAQGLALVERDDLEGAERKFREALESDLYYAPAHNNLGLVLVQTEHHYEAAWEFQYAARLAPHSAEPRQNLGLLYETLGRLDQAIAEYETALEIQSDDVVAMRHLARACVKAERNDDRLKTLLEKLLLIPSGRQWDEWVRGQFIRLSRPESEDRSFKLTSPG